MFSKNTVIVNAYSLVSYYVEIYFDDTKLSNATCFFTKRGEKRYLISNWHVVSGKDADTLQCLDKNAAIPNKLRIYLPKETEDGLVYDEDFVNIDLYDTEGFQCWYELKKGDKMVDVAVIPLKEELGKYVYCIEDAEQPFNENVSLNIADEIFIIGFPFGRIGGVLPIWKKASVASEPTLDLYDMPYYFADTATKPGMSGSPVVLYEKRPVVIAESLNGKFSDHKTKFMGIYSGRIGANTENKNDAQLGRVWKTETIDEMIDLFESNDNMKVD